MSHNLDKSYFENGVFQTLNDLAKFYSDLAHGMFLWIQLGLEKTINIDTYTFSSIQGTLESIEMVLKNGRINDSFALLRKYFDSVIINVYTSLYLHENYSIENFVVTKINEWKKGKSKLPKTADMIKYIIKSETVSHITKHVNADLTYQIIRDRCNDHMHYNFYKTFLYNDNKIFISNREAYLNSFHNDLKNIFVLHFAYEFSIKPHYMSSSDYIDHLDCNMTPPKDCQYWVASYIQKIFDNYIKKVNIEIAQTIKNTTSMFLE